MPKVSQEHRDARRHQILDAATRCFARNGIRETTIHQICAESTLSAGAIYGYFESKQAILYAVFDRHMSTNRDLPMDIRDADDPIEAMRDLCVMALGFVDDPRYLVEHRLSVMVFAEALRDPVIAQKYNAVPHDVLSRLLPQFQALQDDALIDPALDLEYTMRAISATFLGFRIHKLLQPERDTARFTAALLEMLDRTLWPDWSPSEK